MVSLFHPLYIPGFSLPCGWALPWQELFCKERYKEGLLWAGRGTIPVNELA